MRFLQYIGGTSACSSDSVRKNVFFCAKVIIIKIIFVSLQMHCGNNPSKERVGATVQDFRGTEIRVFKFR